MDFHPSQGYGMKLPSSPLYGDNTLEAKSKMKPDLLVIYRFSYISSGGQSGFDDFVFRRGHPRPLQFTKSLLFVPILLLYWIVRRFKKPVSICSVRRRSLAAVLAFFSFNHMGAGRGLTCWSLLVLLYFFMGRQAARPHSCALLCGAGFAGIYIYTLALSQKCLWNDPALNTGVYWLLTILSENQTPFETL